jgi:hypothetical protein
LLIKKEIQVLYGALDKHFSNCCCEIEIKILLLPLSTSNIYYFQGNICLQEGLKAKKKDWSQIYCNRQGHLKENHKLDPFESKHLEEVTFELQTSLEWIQLAY